MPSQRHSFEPFGGPVYRRDYSVKPKAHQPRQENYLWYPGLALALSIAWQVTNNWTSALIGLNLISYVLQVRYEVWEDNGFLTQETLRDFSSAHRLIASAFLHAGWLHLAFNMSTLLYFGRIAEPIFGPGRFLLIYLGSAIVASLGSIYGKRRRNIEAPSVGASGGVIGLIAALAIFRARHHIPSNELWITLLANVAVGFFPMREVDGWGHLGGALGGALISYLWGPRYVWALGGILVKNAPFITWPFA